MMAHDHGDEHHQHGSANSSSVRPRMQNSVQHRPSKLEQRLGGRVYAKQRLGIETDHEISALLRLARSFVGKSGPSVSSEDISGPKSEEWNAVYQVVRHVLGLR
jgi:hypothetical protein